MPFLDKIFVKTPFGIYHPDFEFKDRYIEIKSTYTKEIFLGEKENINGEYTKKQFKKIQWINQNIKPIEIIIMDSNTEIKEIIIL